MDLFVVVKIVKSVFDGYILVSVCMMLLCDFY